MKRVLNYLIAFIVLVGILLANGCAIETETQPQILTDVEKENTETQINPTATEIIPTATEVPAYIVKDSTEAFTSAQETINQSTEVVAQKERLQRWLDYWVQFDNRPFALDSADIHWKYIYDDPAEPQEAVVLIEVSGPDYKNQLFGVPMNEEGFVDFPPPVTGTSIQPGLGPLEINPNKDNTQLSIDQGDLVRLSPEGKIVERLVAGHWEEETLIKGNIFQDPQSKAEFDTVVLAPSPIDDPENFTLFQEEYLQKINEQAETYRDQAINEYFGIAGSEGFFLFHSSVWKPIASYKFKWEGQEILNKTFLYTSRQGDLVPITLTYATENSWFFDEEFAYQTPDGSQKMDLYVLYTFDERRQKEYPGDFIGQFLPTAISSELQEAVSQIWSSRGVPTQADYEMLSKTPLILWSFQEER